MTEPTTRTTYRRADGELIWGEYSYVHDLEFFEDEQHCDGVDLIKEVWVLQETTPFNLHPDECHYCWKPWHGDELCEGEDV